METTVDWDRAPFERMLATAAAGGWRKRDIAARLGITPSTLSDWIKGKHRPLPVYQRQFERVAKDLGRRERKR